GHGIRLIAPAEAEVAEELGGLVVKSPSERDTDLEVRCDQIVNPGREEMANELLSLVLGEQAEVLGMDVHAFAQWDLEHRRGRPDTKSISYFAGGLKADRRIELPAVAELPAGDVPYLELR